MARSVFLALLVALALPVGVAGTPAQAEPAAIDLASLDDIAILTIGENSRADFVEPSLDIATATALQRETAAARLDRYALQAEFEVLSSTEARQALLFEAATDVEIRITSLRDQERALRSDYANRELDSEAFVRRLARIHARVALLRTTLRTIGASSEEIPQFSIRSRVRLLDAALFGFEGPVRKRALETYRGEAPPPRLFVQASDRGVVLATIEEGRYIREAYRADHRDPDSVSGISLSDAAERTSELYPRAYNASVSIRTGISGLSGGLFRIDIELREGSIRAFLDGTTGDVFFEVQERKLDLLGSRATAVGTANGTRLSVARSYPGGPLEITVTDNETGEPVRAEVLVGDSTFETGVDGAVWTLAPASVTFDVRAIRPSGNVTITVRPFAPRTVTTEG
ncbi:MAG: hypothetical protein ABEH59_06165 [Halobacteriales archaeon]